MPQTRIETPLLPVCLGWTLPRGENMIILARELKHTPIAYGLEIKPMRVKCPSCKHIGADDKPKHE
jgi:hypothetical protein